MATDTLFVIGLMMVVSLTWATLALPRLRKRLPKIYLIARSWWWMLAILCSCYLIAKIGNPGHYPYSQYPYQWLLVGFFIFIGLRGLYEVLRLRHPKSKARLLRKLQARGLQLDSAVINNPLVAIADTDLVKPPKPISATIVNTPLHLLDIILFVTVIILTISLIALQQLTWQRGTYGVLMFVLFACQFNDIAQYLCGRLLKNKLFKRGLAPRISPNKSIEGAIFGSMLAALLASVLGVWLTPFSWWLCLLAAYMLAVCGIAGDLLASAFKRYHGVKDTGTLLAGHGGILDRIDSLLIGVPLFTLCYWLFG